MTEPRHGKTLDVYLEPDEPLTPEQSRSTYHESEIPKMRFRNIVHPEWVASVLRNVRNIKRVVDFGTSKDDESRHVMTVIFEGDQVTDTNAFRSMVRYAIENSGAHETHL